MFVVERCGGMTRRRVAIAILVAVAGLSVAGCSDTHTLGDSASVAPFVADASRGDHASWKLASNASPQASHAWQDKHRIEEVGDGLRAWPEWGCKGVAMLARGSEDVVAALTVERDGAPVQTVNLLLPAAAVLPRAELGDAVSAVCNGSH
jgi:hypothetical protein